MSMECVNPIFVRKTRIHVRCGKCLACKERIQKEWSGRLAFELRKATDSLFVTFTYNDEYLFNLPWGHLDAKNEYEFEEATKQDDFASMLPKLSTSDFQSFLSDLKNFTVRGMPKYYQGKPKIPLRYLKIENFRYFVVGEYGSKNKRPHWHMLIFNFPYSKDETSRIFEFFWSYENRTKSKGFIHLGNVTEASIDYVTNYLLKEDKSDCKRLISKRIGKRYVTDKITSFHRDRLDDIVHVNHRKYPMSRYIKNQIFTETEKKLIGEKKLDYALDKASERPSLKMERYEHLKQKTKNKLSKK